MNNTIRKGLAVAIIVLFIVVSLIPLSSTALEKQPINAGSPQIVFYVDDDFDESTPGWNVTHFNKIKNAINLAIDGDTVFVYSGTYDEILDVNKSINLIGEDKNTTIIDGSPKLVSVIIDGNNIDITGFTIQTPGLSHLWRRGIIVYNDSININIYNNIISKNYLGIDLRDIDGMVEVQVYNNYFIDNKYSIEGQANLDSLLEIFNNTFRNNEVGLIVYTNYSVYNNIISDNSIGISVRIGLTSAVYNNQIENNKVGLKILHCSGTQIYENNFINNDRQASVLKYAYIFFGERFFPSLKFLHSLKQKWSNNYWDD